MKGFALFAQLEKRSEVDSGGRKRFFAGSLSYARVQNENRKGTETCHYKSELQITFLREVQREQVSHALGASSAAQICANSDRRFTQSSCGNRDF